MRNPWKTHWALASSKGNQATTQGKEEQIFWPNTQWVFHVRKLSNCNQNYEWKLKHEERMKPVYRVAVTDAITSQNKTVPKTKQISDETA